MCRLSILSLLLVGCGLSPDAFDERYVAATCEPNNVCRVEAGLEEIVCALAAPEEVAAGLTCEFDADEAQLCLDAIEETPPSVCDDGAVLTVGNCHLVYTRCN